jgi:hypothetical protein
MTFDTQSSRGLSIYGLGMTCTTCTPCSDQTMKRARKTRHINGWCEIFVAVWAGLHAMTQLNAEGDIYTASSTSRAILPPKKLAKGSAIARSVLQLGCTCVDLCLGGAAPSIVSPSRSASCTTFSSNTGSSPAIEPSLLAKSTLEHISYHAV